MVYYMAYGIWYMAYYELYIACHVACGIWYDTLIFYCMVYGIQHGFNLYDYIPDIVSCKSDMAYGMVY